jgi:hypothetical protein
MKMLTFVIALMMSMIAHAGFEGLGAGVSKGVFNRINCSTGLTCTKVGNKFTLVSSPTITSGAFSVSGIEAGDAVLTLDADEGDDNGDTWKIESLAAGGLSFYNDVSGSDVVKLSLSTAGALSLVGDLSGDGGDQLVGFLNNQVAATATTITAAQCGSTFINSGAIEMELPEASTVLGCRLTFIVGNASNFTIDPDAADQIMLLTDAAGDSLIADAVGESVTIEAISASAWAPVGSEKGTWTDSN